MALPAEVIAVGMEKKPLLARALWREEPSAPFSVAEVSLICSR
jgi:hypothetical protein